jgi:hypothetical protein
MPECPFSILAKHKSWLVTSQTSFELERVDAEEVSSAADDARSLGQFAGTRKRGGDHDSLDKSGDNRWTNWSRGQEKLYDLSYTPLPESELSRDGDFSVSEMTGAGADSALKVRSGAQRPTEVR